VSPPGNLVDLAARTRTTTQVLLQLSGAELIELAKENNVGVLQRKRITKEAEEMKAKAAFNSAPMSDPAAPLTLAPAPAPAPASVSDTFADGKAAAVERKKSGANANAFLVRIVLLMQ
jgi:hypothetical protein